MYILRGYETCLIGPYLFLSLGKDVSLSKKERNVLNIYVYIQYSSVAKQVKEDGHEWTCLNIFTRIICVFLGTELVNDA